MNKITFCIPSKNNLRYLKTCIPSIRENAYRDDHDIIIFVDSDDDGTISWLDEHQSQYRYTYYVNPNIGKSLFGIGKAYDYCIEHSTTDVFMVFHADMMLGKHADLEAYNKLKTKTVVCSTRIEPPLHPNNGEKILQDFGLWPEEFRKDDFNKFVDVAKKEYHDKVTDGIFAPWMMYKSEFLNLGGHDPIMKSAREDSDLFNRMKLGGFEFVQSWSSLVYHLTGRGGQFQHGEVSTDEKRKSDEWQKLMQDSTKEFIRKWGSYVNHTALMHPIIKPKYDIAIVLNNSTGPLVKFLEPWCNRIFIDIDPSPYILEEQGNTQYDLTTRVHTIGSGDPKDYHDIVVEMDGKTINDYDYNIIQHLAAIINDAGDSAYLGDFEISNLKIHIQNLTEYQKDLIVCSTSC